MANAHPENQPCAAHFAASDRTRRICQLDKGHEGGCAGPMDPAIRRALRQGAKAQHAQLEASQRAERAQAALAPARGADMSPATFASLILEAARAGAASFPEVLAFISKALGSPEGLRVNGRPAGVKEIRQTAHRLQRDGQAMLDGNSIIAL